METQNGGMQPPGSYQFEKGEPHLDGLMRWLARHYADDTILAYPNARGGYDAVLTGADMERVTAHAAARYAEAFARLQDGRGVGVPGDVGFGGLDTPVVAMVGVSTLGSHVTYIALHRLGLSPMLLSPRLAAAGYAHLVREAGCRCVVAGGPSADAMRAVARTCLDGGGGAPPLEVVPMLDDDEVLAALAAPRVDLPAPACSPGHVVHTGGTTGLPKAVPMFLHEWMAKLPLTWAAQREAILCTLPVFHAYGLGTFVRSMRTATPVYLLNAFRPVTASIIWRALDATGAKHLYTVPYVLKFFADVEGGIARLGKLSSVRPGGSALPDDLGDELVRNGVNLGIVYGQTESGCPMVQAGTGLGEWNWLTPLPYAEKFIRFDKVGDNMYHLVLLAGLDSLKISDGPDGSYASKDLFQPHPDNLPGGDTRAGKAKWKFLARQGDIVVLVNGENADPTPVEHAVMLEPTIQMAVAFGAGHERMGLLVIPSEKAGAMSKEEVIKSIKPALERGNKLAADYAKISADDIIVKPAGTEYPQTAKMTLQRPVLNQLFADDIEAHYAAREAANGNVVLSDEDVRAAVRRVVEQEFKDRASSSPEGAAPGHSEPRLDDDDDFFALGMDSLQSSLVRRRLRREIPIPAEVDLATNVVFEYPTVKLLSEHILDLRQRRLTSDGPAARDPETVAKAMVQKYANLVTSAEAPGRSASASSMGRQNGHRGHVIVLTGATGYIGAQLLNILLGRPDVSLVYCLVRTRRAGDHQAAAARIRTALENSDLSGELTLDRLSKLKCLSSNLAAADLGLSPSEYGEIKSGATAIIHNAWSVNFNMSLASFEPNVASVAHLLRLTRGGPDPQRACTFVFISSVAAVGGARNGDGAAEERMYGWQDAKPHNGYGQSKWVAEQVCAAAAESQPATLGSVRVLRVGQVSGDTKHGIWNPAEAIPAMVQSALTIGALPKMQDVGGNVLRWLPSDVTAAVITDLTMLDLERRGEPLAVFHVASPHTLRWNEDVLPAVEQAGINFRAVAQREWVQMLGDGDKNIETNPPYKLIEHFRQSYGGSREDKAGKDMQNGFDEGGVLVRLDLTRSTEYSPSLKSAPPLDRKLLVRYVQFWSKYWAQKKTKPRSDA